MMYMLTKYNRINKPVDRILYSYYWDLSLSNIKVKDFKRFFLKYVKTLQYQKDSL